MDITQFRKSLNNDNLRIQDLNSVKADFAEVPGRVMINGSGEAHVDVDFPVKFTTLPFFKPGFERQEGQEFISGQMPTGRAYVAEWKTVERLPLSVYYVGAKIHVVTTGQFYDKMILNFSFTGTALTNPSA